MQHAKAIVPMISFCWGDGISLPSSVSGPVGARTQDESVVGMRDLIAHGMNSAPKRDCSKNSTKMSMLPNQVFRELLESLARAIQVPLHLWKSNPCRVIVGIAHASELRLPKEIRK